MSKIYDTFEEEAPRQNARIKRHHGSRRKRRKVVLNLWGRGLLAAIALCGTTFFAIHTALYVARPYELGARQAETLAQATAERDALVTQNAELDRQCAYLNRPDGIESAARNLGYLRPGEISLVIVPAAPKSAPGH